MLIVAVAVVAVVSRLPLWWLCRAVAATSAAIATTAATTNATYW